MPSIQTLFFLQLIFTVPPFRLCNLHMNLKLLFICTHLINIYANRKIQTCAAYCQHCLCRVAREERDDAQSELEEEATTLYWYEEYLPLTACIMYIHCNTKIQTRYTTLQFVCNRYFLNGYYSISVDGGCDYNGFFFYFYFYFFFLIHAFLFCFWRF